MRRHMVRRKYFSSMDSILLSSRSTRSLASLRSASVASFRYRVGEKNGILGLDLRLDLRLFSRVDLRLFLRVDLRLFLRLFLRVDLRLSLGLDLGLFLRVDLRLFLRLSLRLSLRLFSRVDSLCSTYNYGRLHTCMRLDLLPSVASLAFFGLSFWKSLCWIRS